MKKILFAALAATVFLASCSQDDDKVNAGKGEETQLTVKITGTAKSRAVEIPGVEMAGTIKLNGGHIFIIDGVGNIDASLSVALNTTTATGAGQVINAVPSGSRVYIIGNLPAGFNPAAYTTFASLKAATAAITGQTDYKETALANADGQPMAITIGTGNTATASIALKPLISRLELVQVKGKSADDAIGTITGFDVVGVYVDDYYPNFTFDGNCAGTMFSQGSSNVFTGYESFYADTGTWSASSLVATPAGTDIWAYQVASQSLPRLIVELDNVVYDDLSSVSQTLTDKYYLTVSTYNGGGLTKFERGKIYKISSLDFGPADLDLTPNPSNVQLTVNVTVTEWVIETPTAELL